MFWIPWTTRWMALLAWATWVGGFMLYGGVVIPILHEDLDSLEAGAITRRVTDWLNLLGLVALTLAACDLYLARGERQRRSTPLVVGAWGVSAVTLAALLGLHRVMDHHLDVGTMTGFYPLHRYYLRLSTAQWLANLALSARWVPARFEGRRGALAREDDEDFQPEAVDQLRPRRTS